ncbi:quinone oxidoreductase family protein [Aureimonas glaciei]|uniref:Quinone oxidoreductase n=1 Tax=Aureimonas glaciei TaxID=1776957 RepID=A0A916Y1E9_9HYPH|nr:quinone oxidoreductase [Aureimonas glaciei]GGD26039.1 quinone oxidoreductase [Aureimonas glaciei]
MTIAIQLTQTGGPDVLVPHEVEVPSPGPGEAIVEQRAVGVNYLDAMHRKGAVPIPVPGGIGLEAAGTVVAVGSGVSDVAVGDRVAYALGPVGAYAAVRAYPAERLVRLPEGLSFEEAAAITFKGITAQYLLKNTYPVGPGTVVVLYGVAGALGQVMAPWAKRLGAFVIGVVSKEASVAIAKSRGCDAVLVWGSCDLAGEVSRLTDGRKADVVYDGIGRETFAASVDSLRPRGLMVSLGASSGLPDPVSVATLQAKGSLYLTRPSIAAYAADLAEYRERARDVYEAAAAGIIKPEIWKTYPLEQVAQAHEAMDSGTSNGPIVLVP